MCEGPGLLNANENESASDSNGTDAQKVDRKGIKKTYTTGRPLFSSSALSDLVFKC